MNNSTVINLLTIDVEDYFQVENFRKTISLSDWNKFESRVEQNTDKILGILEEFNTKATFFVLGWVAERYPQVVKKICKIGHEIACHGYSHQLVFEHTPQEFREDIRKAKKILEDISSQEVIGYRAPTFSIIKNSLWALDILIEEGFKYDASFFPAAREKGGIPGSERFLHTLKRNEDSIQELPISTINVLGKNLIFSGGGYFRLLPYCLIKKFSREINNLGQPLVTYFHPWEFDARQPRIKADAMKTFKHYINIKNNEAKFRSLLSDFRFCAIRDLLKIT